MGTLSSAINKFKRISGGTFTIEIPLGLKDGILTTIGNDFTCGCSFRSPCYIHHLKSLETARISYKYSRFVTDTTGVTESDFDDDIYRFCLFCKSLVSWNLPIPLSFDQDASLSAETIEKLEKFPAPVLSKIICEFFLSIRPLKEESELIDKQTATLYGGASNSQVAAPAFPISLHCDIIALKESLGCDYNALYNMPMRDIMQELEVLKTRNSAVDKATPKQSKMIPKTNLKKGGLQVISMEAAEAMEKCRK